MSKKTRREQQFNIEHRKLNLSKSNISYRREITNDKYRQNIA